MQLCSKAEEPQKRNFKNRLQKKKQMSNKLISQTHASEMLQALKDLRSQLKAGDLMNIHQEGINKLVERVEFGMVNRTVLDHYYDCRDRLKVFLHCAKSGATTHNTGLC